jgi:hypothetical protein
VKDEERGKRVDDEKKAIKEKIYLHEAEESVGECCFNSFRNVKKEKSVVQNPICWWRKRRKNGKEKRREKGNRRGVNKD